MVTATQAGCALALLLLVPLGDRVERRRLMIVQSLALVAAPAVVSAARSVPVLLIGMLCTGLLGTAMTRALIAYAVAAAAPHERGRVVGTPAAARAGHWADRGWAQRTSSAALALLLLAWRPRSILGQSLGRSWWASCCSILAARPCM